MEAIRMENNLKIKIGTQVEANECPTKVAVSGTFQGYLMEDPEDPTSLIGTVLGVKNEMTYLWRVYPDSIKVSESEDERIIERIKKAVVDYWSDESLDEILAWLEKQKPAEWSEEDEKMLKFSLQFLDYHKLADPTAQSCKDWLKSLRPQSHWKPSKEQMEALESAYSILKEHDTWDEDEHLPVLLSLVNDLKKLM